MKTVKNYASFLNEREIPDKQGKILIIMGPPGSGKGTLSKKLQERNGFQHISTGELVRKSEDPEVKSTIEKGEYVSDKLITRILRKELSRLDLETGIIIDGFPRTLSQSKTLDTILGKLGVGLNHCIFLDIDEEEARKRILKRSKKENRKDDQDPEIIDKRFQEYREKTEPILDKYKKSRKLIKIDASSGSESVYDSLVRKLGIKRKEIGKKEQKEIP